MPMASYRQKTAIAAQTKASHTAGSFQAVIKTLRLAIQSVAIGLGAFLVLQQEISPGMLIAGSILVGRALHPIEMAVGSWKGFADAKGQYQRLRLLLEQADWQQEKMSLPNLAGTDGDNVADLVGRHRRRCIELRSEEAQRQCPLAAFLAGTDGSI